MDLSEILEATSLEFKEMQREKETRIFAKIFESVCEEVLIFLKLLGLTLVFGTPIKPLVGISPIIMSMFNEYNLDQYLTIISDVISWVEEEHEIL